MNLHSSIHQKIQMNFSLWLILFVIFLDNLGIGLVYPMFSSMTFTSESPFLESQTSEILKGSYLGIMLAATPLTAFFSGPIIGAFSDQKGRRPLFIFCLSLAIVGYAVSIVGVYAKSILILIISRVIVGLADGSMGVVAAAIADLSTNDEVKTKNFGLYGMMSGIGFAVGPILGGFFSGYGFAIPFLIAGIGTLINLLLILKFFKETHLVRKSNKISLVSGLKNIKKAFQLPALRVLFILSIFFCMGWSFFYEFLPVIWITDYGFDSTKVGFFFAYGAIWYAVATGILIRPIVHRFKPSKILVTSLIVLGLSILLLLIHPPLNLVWIYLAVINFLAAMIYPTYSTMISDCAGKDAQGEILGIAGSLQAFAFAMSPIVGGFLVGIQTHLPMLIGGVSILLASFIFWPKRKY